MKHFSFSKDIFDRIKSNLEAREIFTCMYLIKRLCIKYIKKSYYHIAEHQIFKRQRVLIVISPKNIYKRQTHEKMPTFKTSMRYILTLIIMVNTLGKNPENNKCWQGYGEIKTLGYCWVECKLA